MATISLRISSDEEKLLQTYLAAHNLNISSFIRQVVFDKIEDDLALDEKRILRARNRINKEKHYSHEEVWKELGVQSMYEVIFTDSALKELKKLDKPVVRVIKNWVVKNLVDCVDPRIHGKPLKGNLKGVWRYRVGDYRLFADIQDDKLVIFLFEVAHRKEIYK